MTVAATIYRQSAEREARVAASIDATVRNPAAEPLDATVLDISASGIRAAINDELQIGDPVSVGLGGVGMVAARVVRREGREYGCAFLTPITPAEIAAAMAGTAVIDGGFARMPSPAPLDAEPDVALWPGYARLGTVVGASLVLWGLLIGGARALLG